MLRAVLAALSLLMGASLSTSAHADEIDRIVAAEIQRQHSPAVAIAVVRNGRAAKVQAYGSANLELKTPATPATFFQTGSIGKQFTASLVMLLARDGVLKLDEPIGTYLRDVPPAWSAITVRHLLTHTSGLPETDPAVDLRKDYTEDELLASAFKLPLRTRPGQGFEYSNLGYQVLGVLCSSVGHRFWGEQMHERVFAPLGMASRVISERDLIPNRAAGYERFEGRFENQAWVAPSQNTTADGSLYVSARDMALWGMALDGQRLLSAEQKRAMWTSGVLDDGNPTGYGFGWDLRTQAGHRIVSHRGDWQGFTSFITHLPDDRLTVVVLMNRANGQPQVIAEQIVGRYIAALRPPRVSPPTALELGRQALFVRPMDGKDKPGIPLIVHGPGQWQASLALAPGMHQFRIGDERGQAIDLGARIDEVIVRPGQKQVLETRGEGLFLEVKEPGEYVFRLDVPPRGAPALTVTR